MVDLTQDLAESLGVKKDAAHAFEEKLSDYDRRLIGPAGRLDITLDSRARLSDYADLLSALATRLRALKADTTMHDRHCLMEAGRSIRITAREMREMRAARKGWNPRD